ncbi:potassium-transporting ATPase subunit F [Candidatus Berkiella aquae]|uniref:Potassium-transporting ATPase subunit F n=1 Tax=Candidatus Berkiella aquae TaxID=295108 RepID=A0AAE3L8B0_9GAMM|nr:potassium-transporting ATPase subunit F [Candidatus Berkiella aquae]
MGAIYLISGVTGFLLIIYLLIALLKPELFS